MEWGGRICFSFVFILDCFLCEETGICEMKNKNKNGRRERKTTGNNKEKRERKERKERERGRNKERTNERMKEGRNQGLRNFFVNTDLNYYL
jgi:hypothetical protein